MNTMQILSNMDVEIKRAYCAATHTEPSCVDRAEYWAWRRQKEAEFYRTHGHPASQQPNRFVHWLKTGRAW